MRGSARAGPRVQPGAGDYVACYLLYAVVLGLSVLTFVIWREVVELLVDLFWGPQNANQFFYALFVFLIGLALFILVLVAEPYMRGGLRRRALRPRFFQIALPLAGAIVLGVALINLINFLPLAS